MARRRSVVVSWTPGAYRSIHPLTQAIDGGKAVPYPASLERRAVALALAVPGVAAPATRLFRALGLWGMPKARVTRNRSGAFIVEVQAAAIEGTDLQGLGLGIQDAIRRDFEAYCDAPLQAVRVCITNVKARASARNQQVQGRAT